MPGQSNNGMQCGEFDALLSDALDGKLTGSKLEAFQLHSHECAVCGPLLADAQAGQYALKSLDEIEPPAHLAHNILIATTGRDVTVRAQAPARSFKDLVSAWSRSIFSPVVALARQPRFAMSFGMVFFSLSVSMSLAGIKVSDLRRLDLRPTAIKRTYYETSGKVVKYYENIRFVYELESRVREFKRITAPAQPEPEKNENKQRKNNSEREPEQRQERNYSQGEGQPQLALIPINPPVVTVSTNRRLG